MEVLFPEKGIFQRIPMAEQRPSPTEWLMWVWFSNLIRAFEIPVVLSCRLCVHSQGSLCLSSFSFETQEKSPQKLVNSAPWWAAGGWSNPKRSGFNGLENKGLCGCHRQYRNSKGKVISAPGASLSDTNKRQQEAGAQDGLVGRGGVQRNYTGQHDKRGRLIVNPIAQHRPSV